MRHLLLQRKKLGLQGGGGGGGGGGAARIKVKQNTFKVGLNDYVISPEPFVLLINMTVYAYAGRYYVTLYHNLKVILSRLTRVLIAQSIHHDTVLETLVMVNVLKFGTLSLLNIYINVGYQGWNSQNACQNSKQGRSDCFSRSK